MREYKTEEFVDKNWNIKIIDKSEYKKPEPKQPMRRAIKKIFQPEKNAAMIAGSYSSDGIEKLPWYQILIVKRWNVFKIFWGSCLLNIIVIAFIIRAETIPSGVSGIPTLLLFVIPELQPYFGVMFLVSNLPLMIVYHNRVKKSFIILNWCYLIFSLLWSSILNITPINDLITSTTDISGGWDLLTLSSANIRETWPIPVYGTIGAILNGLNYALLWSSGSSTAGTDIVSYYYSVKKQKNVGSLMRAFSLGTTAVYFIFYVIWFWDKSTTPVDGDAILRRSLFVMQLVTTVLIIFISTFIVNLLYPKYKKVNLEITTNNPERISTFFNMIDYWHSYKIESFTSGWSKKPNYQISTVVYYFEAKNLVRDLQNFDPQSWIKMTDVKRTWGKFNSFMVD